MSLWGWLAAFRFHPNDALAAYFDDDEDVFDLACELLAVMGAPAPTSNDSLDISWGTIRDMALSLNERVHIPSASAS